MSDKQPPDASSSHGNIPPPKELPNFFAQQKSTIGFVPPVPPQLHPFPPQPTITVAPPTPSTRPTSQESAPTERHSEPAQIPVTSESVTTSMSGDVKVTESTPVVKSNESRPTPPPPPVAVGMSEAEAALDKLEEREEEGGSMFGWLQKTVTHSAFLSKVADKAKTGMDSVLTTLDPGMKDFLRSEGAVDIVIASDNGRIIAAIADGFRRVFSTVTYRGMGTPGASSLLPQIVGYTFALTYVKERITLLRGSGLAGNKSAIVALQPFLHEIQGSWYESAVIAIQKDDINVHVFTQPVDVDSRVIAILKEHTPSGYAANAFSTTVGIGYAEVFGIDPDDWQQNSLSYSSSELYRLASAALAAAYKRKFGGSDT
uniref:Protein PRRC1 n=1 Tax=Ascaris suum TaxID=6253 RepID=F1L7H7_ASCSU